MHRGHAILASFLMTVAFNGMAGVITLVYANGTTIVETNPLSRALLQDYGPGALLVHVAAIMLLYPIAYGVSRAISSRRPLFTRFRAKEIYLFAFVLLLAILPAGAMIDLFSDILVVTLSVDLLVGPQKIVLLSLFSAIPLAVLQVRRRWSLAAFADGSR